MSNLAIILPVRKNSQRVPNKMLRPFGNSTLFEIALDKLEDFKHITYVAAYGQEFIDICEKRNFRYVRRTEESASAENHILIHSGYLKKMQEEWVMFFNPCIPLCRSETINFAAKTLYLNMGKGGFGGLFTVKKCPLLIWNSEQQVVNKDVGKFNSKTRDPCYVATDAILAFRRQFFLEKKTYWAFREHDPELLVVDEEESIDINTMFEFEMAEFLWERQYSDRGKSIVY